jgi:hypothetical protein
MSGECETCGNHTLYCECGEAEPIQRYKPEWGFHNLMVLAAFRYCLGRRSYIVSICVDWLIRYWQEIDHDTRKIIIKEIAAEAEKGDTGDTCDAEVWQELVRHSTEPR